MISNMLSFLSEPIALHDRFERCKLPNEKKDMTYDPLRFCAHNKGALIDLFLSNSKSQF